MFLLTVSLSLSMEVAVAAGDTSRGETIAAQGNGAGAVACVTGQGADGKGISAAGFPALAGLDAGYLGKQLHDYASGSRQNPVMQAPREQDIPANQYGDMVSKGRDLFVATQQLRGIWLHSSTAMSDHRTRVVKISNRLIAPPKPIISTTVSMVRKWAASAWAITTIMVKTQEVAANKLVSAMPRSFRQNR